MTLSFNPSNSSDSLSLVAGLTADKGAKNGGFPGVGSFMELLKALEQIEPRDDASSLFSAVEADGRNTQDLPTGKDLPGGLPVLQDDLPVLPEGKPEPASSGSSEPLATGHAAKVIPFPGVSPEGAQSAPILSGDIAIAPPKPSHASNTELAPAAASPIASPLVLADRSVDAAAIPASGVSKAPTAAIPPSFASKEPVAAGSDPKTPADGRKAPDGNQDIQSAPKGETVQVRISATPEARSVWTGGPALVSLSTADLAKPQAESKAAAKGDGLQVSVSASSPARPVGLAPVPPTLTVGKAADALQPSPNSAVASNYAPSIARIELQAITSGARSEPKFEAEVPNNSSTSKPTLTVQPQGTASANPTATPRNEVTTQAPTRTETLPAGKIPPPQPI